MDAYNKVVASKDWAFEKEKEKVAWLYPNLDLCKLDLFKVVKYDKLVVEETPMNQKATLLQRILLL